MTSIKPIFISVKPFSVIFISICSGRETHIIGSVKIFIPMKR